MVLSIASSVGLKGWMCVDAFGALFGFIAGYPWEQDTRDIEISQNMRRIAPFIAHSLCQSARRFMERKLTVLDYVSLGNDSETGALMTIGDIERRSGLYILGRPRTGKTTLIESIIEQDIEHGHGVFFLDPHGDAIEDLKKRIPSKRQHEVVVLDPTDETHAFGINLLACKDITSRGERRDTYTKAYNVFKKLFADESGTWGPWMQQALEFTLHAFIENQECTLAEVPLFLDPKEKAFRNYSIQEKDF